jgi:hypothetical protein
MTVSIIAACLPTLAPLLTERVYGRFLEKIYSFSSSRRRTGAQNTTDRSKSSSKPSGYFTKFGSGDNDKFGSGEIPVIRDGDFSEDGHMWLRNSQLDEHIDTTDIELARVKGNYAIVTAK